MLIASLPEVDAMFLMNAWYIAAEAGEVERGPLGRIILGEPVVIYRKSDGVAVALEDRCRHRLAPRHKGQVVGDALQCGYHGFTFGEDGVCTRVPGLDRVPPGVRVRGYPLAERHGWLWIWMGETSRADESLIPDFHTNVDPAWATTGVRMPIAANYLLFVDNLLDLSHVGFVHPGTIGSDDTSASLRYEQVDGFVRGVRESIDIATPPHNLKQGFAPRSDQTKIMTFLPPCHVTIDITTTERAETEPRKKMHIFLINSITPETERTSHYFWASTRDFAVDDARVTEFFHKVTLQAFVEDQNILEAQQATIDLDPTAPIVNVPGDLGGIYARRMMDEAIASEARSAVWFHVSV